MVVTGDERPTRLEYEGSLRLPLALAEGLEEIVARDSDLSENRA